jgi:hypothetical protein
MRTKRIPIVINGGLDTKTNPKLLQPGAALQIDNMYQQRTGEWSVRNGMPTQSATALAISSAPMAYASPAGGVSAVVRGLANASGTFAQAAPARYGTRGTSLTGWEGSNGNVLANYWPFPAYAALTSGLYGDGSNDVFDGDYATLGTLAGAVAKGANNKYFDTATGRVADYGTVLSSTGGAPRMVATTNYIAMVGTQSGGPYDIQIFAYSAAGVFASYTPVVAGLAAAAPWFDVTQNPGTDTITVAYKATAGGVTAFVFDLSTGAITVGPTNYAAVDASMALALVDTRANFPTGHATLVTAGAADGLAYYIITTATLVSGAKVTLDAAATVNIRQLAGHWDTGSQITVLYEVSSGVSRLFDTVKRVRFNGAATIITLAPSFSIYSRTAKGADGKWYFIGAYDSPVQGSYALLTCDEFTFSSGGSVAAAPVCQVMAGEGGGRRSVQSSVTNLLVSGTSFLAALPRKRRVNVAGVSAQQGRILQLATFSDVTTTASRPREVGGVTYLPGGLIYGDDGQNCRAVVFPRYVEVPALASSNAGGAMTSSKSYGYRIVIRRQDSAGRILRSAASIPVTITLGAADNTVTLTVPNPYIRWTDSRAFNVFELYRVGPIENGATLYNKVLTSSSLASFTADTFTLTDQLSDANAALGEAAYFTGNTEENIAPPSTSLLEVNGGRIWIVNAEDPTELWPSKQVKAGTIPGFTFDFAFRVDGDSKGAITALGSMDGRLIVFKDGATWVVSGDGPNDLDQGSFSPPQLVSRDTGVAAGLARSVVSTPDGLMFQAARGICLLDRGLGVSYIGAPVEAYTLSANVVDASTVRGTSQVRFVMASGRCLVWDFQVKQWSTFILPVGGSTIVACVDAPQGWYYVTADGKLRKDTAGTTTDDGAAIVPVLSLPHLAFDGFIGYQRLYSLKILLDGIGNCTLAMDAEFNYSGAVTGFPRTIALTAGATAQVEYNPPDGKAKSAAVRPVLTVLGSPLGGTFRLTSVTATIGIKDGSNISDGNRMT